MLSCHPKRKGSHHSIYWTDVQPNVFKIWRHTHIHLTHIWTYTNTQTLHITHQITDTYTHTLFFQDLALVANFVLTYILELKVRRFVVTLTREQLNSLRSNSLLGETTWGLQNYIIKCGWVIIYDKVMLYSENATVYELNNYLLSWSLLDII